MKLTPNHEAKQFNFIALIPCYMVNFYRVVSGKFTLQTLIRYAVRYCGEIINNVYHHFHLHSMIPKSSPIVVRPGFE